MLTKVNCYSGLSLVYNDKELGAICVQDTNNVLQLFDTSFEINAIDVSNLPENCDPLISDEQLSCGDYVINEQVIDHLIAVRNAFGVGECFGNPDVLLEKTVAKVKATGDQVFIDMVAEVVEELGYTGENAHELLRQ